MSEWLPWMLIGKILLISVILVPVCAGINSLKLSKLYTILAAGAAYFSLLTVLYLWARFVSFDIRKRRVSFPILDRLA
jgi:hypothetical protein